MSAKDRYGHKVEDGVRVRFVRGRPSRVLFGTVASLEEVSGTMVVRTDTGSTFGLTLDDIAVCPVGTKPDGTYIFAGDET